ncbi:MAG: hypothetical protein J6T10_20395 [Methanobrevibacter sp.]|nr:hypothetical protein [Methanobrevibacter sp.]
MKLTNEMKIENVKSTIKLCEDLAKQNRADGKYWEERGYDLLKAFYDGKAQSYELVADWLTDNVRDEL